MYQFSKIDRIMKFWTVHKELRNKTKMEVISMMSKELNIKEWIGENPIIADWMEIYVKVKKLKQKIKKLEVK